jgi:Protein of unknown function (DUF4230)
VVHRESKEFQAEELTIAKGGLKIKQTDLPADAEPFTPDSVKPGKNGTPDFSGTGLIQQLVSVKSTVQKVVGLEEKKYPLGAERILLFVQAQVLAGVDLAELTPANVQVFPARRVRINLPSPRILQTVIDDKQTKVWDRSITWWTPWVPYNPDLERQARLAALDEIDKAAIEGGILDLARGNAETAIRELLETTGVKASVASAT